LYKRALDFPTRFPFLSGFLPGSFSPYRFDPNLVVCTTHQYNMPGGRDFLSPNDIEVVPRTQQAQVSPVHSVFTSEKVHPPKYPRKIQLHIASLEGGPEQSGRSSLNPSISLSVGLLESDGKPFTTARQKRAPVVNWNSNTPAFFVDESSQIRFELNSHRALKKRPRSLGSVTIGIPELLERAPTGTDRESFVEYRIPQASPSSRTSSDSDRGSASEQSSQLSVEDETGLGPVLKFSIRDLVATGAASDMLLPVKPPISPIDSQISH